jgi:LacI family transcriptional regulator
MKSEDIARIVGVSRSTVSRVINNYSNVPEETRVKVLDAISKYNYIPNAQARSLAGKRSETIGVFFIVDAQTDEESKLVYNDFYTTYLDAIVDIANKRGYYVLVQTVFKDDDYEKVTKAFREKRIDGGIIIGTRSNTLQRIQVESFSEPVVIFDYEMSELEQFAKTKHITILNSNDQAASEMAVKYLVDCGHKKIGFIKGVEETLSARLRYDGYIKGCRRNNLVVNETSVMEGLFNQEITYREMEKSILKGTVADAYICANDYMAIAAMDCLQNYGYHIPNDVSIIGFDNTRTGELINTKLTTLSPDFYGMTQRAIDIIHLRYVNESVKIPEMIEYKVNLIVRNSVRSGVKAELV